MELKYARYAWGVVFRSIGGRVRVPEQYIKSVVFLGVERPVNGNRVISYRATGFFVALASPNSGKKFPFEYLVTARHVAEQLISDISFFIRINTLNGRSEILEMPSNTQWFYHEDDAVDLAVLPWDKASGEFDYTTIRIADDVYSPQRDPFISVGSRVMMTGLFADVVGERKNLPIVRTGSLAMIPDERVPTKRGDAEVYLVETRSLGGFSGSPAFAQQSIGSDFAAFRLLGVVHGHWELPKEVFAAYSDEIREETMRAVEQMNTGITVITPAKFLLETLHQPDLADVRKEGDRELARQVSRPDTTQPSRANG